MALMFALVVTLAWYTFHDFNARVASNADEPAPTRSAQTADAEVGPEVLFFGDSYFNGSPFLAKQQSMAYLTAQALGTDPAIAGAGGTGFVATSEAGPSYPDQIARGALGSFGGPPRVLVIEGGLNDRKYRPAEIRAAARTVLERVAFTYPGVKVLLMGPVDPAGDLRDTAPVVRALRSAATASSVDFINAQRWLDGRSDLVAPDYAHPNEAGAKVLAAHLAARLRPFL